MITMDDTFISDYLDETAWIAQNLKDTQIEKAVKILSYVKEHKGRVFVLGVGGSASTASHAVNDLRKICKIQAYASTDNVAELTAITNDKGWEYSFVDWLKESRFNASDCLLMFSVGGGDKLKNISSNLVLACQYAIENQASRISVVGRDGGYIGQNSNATILIPTPNTDMITPHTEEFGGIILHLLVSHPLLKENQTKWETENESSHIS